MYNSEKLDKLSEENLKFLFYELRSVFYEQVKYKATDENINTLMNVININDLLEKNKE